MEEEYSNDSAYGDFAFVYDCFMDNIPYEEWGRYLKGLLDDCGITEGVLVDLGCGTGSMTLQMQQYGFDMIGVDLSEEMLEVARDKCPSDVLLVRQDMRQLELYGLADAMYCVCDGMNYMLEEEDLYRVFTGVKKYLAPEGVFIFDLKTKHFYEETLGDTVIAENREDASFIWENIFHPENNLNEYLLTIYQLADEEQDLFARSEELHYQKAYETEQVIEQMNRAGLEPVAVYDAFTRESAGPDSDRVYLIAKRIDGGK